HEEAIFPVYKERIPINIRNTNVPDNPGTLIVHKRDVGRNIVAGIAGKRNFSLIFIEKLLMNREIGFGRRLFGILESFGVSFEHAPTGIDTMSVIVQDSQLEGKAPAILEEIQHILAPDRVEIKKGFALIATVGEGMAYKTGIAARLFTALAEEKSSILETLELKPKSYYLGTVHRQENTDDTRRLKSILTAMQSTPWPVILPLHPRTRKNLADELPRIKKTLRIIDPVPYLDMLILEKNARVILTDSGGVQKEAYWFKVPCVTMRDETEWVELVDAGCNRLAGADRDAILSALGAFEDAGAALPENRPTDLYGDGHSAEKIVNILAPDAG
ncbi:hypothetical protein LCGC14_1721030, partial [marine sediment metagenome]